MPFHKGDVEATVDDLRHIGLFARMSNSDLTKLAKLGEPVDAVAGAVLMDQGDVGVECFLVLEGEAGVVASGEHLATIGPGSIVGEMALVGHKPRNASVIAQTAMRLLSFDIGSFKRLLDDMPVARDHIYKLLGDRAAANGPH
ncbi:MAG: cyclic nucleotide-binding domain-containing protein [Acidimicrobiales bacterium]